jgi:Tol biopolymer transport system component/serine/threonine protein kinase
MLAQGRHLGPYQILAPIGAGGMGEVYRARDPRLGRDVAVKVLREEVAADPERLRRFEREARAVAALNHPQILAVYDIGSEQGLAYVVFELLEGQTLRDLLKTGPLRARRVIDYGRQVCLGLAAAHARGIVHRDLKPENLFLTVDGQVKILDFGVAKLGGRAAGDDPAALGGTDTATEPGHLIGTADYMSPEQARGQPADARSDLFGLGAILYEMLSGRRAFTGTTPADSIGAILHTDPPEIGVDRAPPALERVVRRCLEKKPKDRFHSAHDLGLALETLCDPASSAPGVATRRRRQRLALAASVLATAGALAVWLPSRRAADGTAARISITPFTSDGGAKDAPSLSPDGEKVAYVWSGPADDNWDIYVKALGVGATPLRLTQHAANDLVPAWSPDGRYIAFVRELGERAAVYTLPAQGGPERKLTEIPYPERASLTGAFFGLQGSLSWSPDGQWLVFAERDSEPGSTHVVRFSLTTGQREALTSPPAGTLGDLCPALSPDGAEVAFVRSGSNTWGLKDVWLQPTRGGRARRLTHAKYGWCMGLDWTADGRDVLFSHPRIPVTVGGISRVSRSGGEPRPALGALGNTDRPSARGSRLLYVEHKPLEFALWRVPGRLGSRGQGPQKLIVSSQRDSNPAYSPDGRKIAFESDRSGAENIWVCERDGSQAVQLTSIESGAGTPRWSPDGQVLVFDSPMSGNSDLYLVAAEGGVPRQLTHEPSGENVGTWSRDGRFIYFTSDRSGSQQIWKMPVDGGHAHQVTRHGGFYAEESWDGRFLYYTPAQGPSGIWRVPATGGDEIEVVGAKTGGDWQDWALGRSGLYYATRRRQVRREEYTIEFVDFDSGTVTTLFRESGPRFHKSLAVSPDERWLLYRAEPPWQSELMLVENFR